MHTAAVRNRRKVMTAIQIVVVAALVFFVAISVLGFIIWKRETEMRTNSIRFIGDMMMNMKETLSESNDLAARELLRKSREESAQQENYAVNKGYENSEQNVQSVSPGSTYTGNMQTMSYDAESIQQDRHDQIRAAERMYHTDVNGDVSIHNDVPGDISVHHDMYMDHSQHSNMGIYEDTQRSIYEDSDYAEHYPESRSGYYDDGAVTGGEISLDFIDQDLMMEDDRRQRLFEEDYPAGSDEQMLRNIGRPPDTGRSGKRYTKSELETLIKE